MTPNWSVKKQGVAGVHAYVPAAVLRSRWPHHRGLRLPDPIMRPLERCAELGIHAHSQHIPARLLREASCPSDGSEGFTPCSEFALDNGSRYLSTRPNRGVSSIGRALPLQGRGYRFEPGTLHDAQSPVALAAGDCALNRIPPIQERGITQIHVDWTLRSS